MRVLAVNVDEPLAELSGLSNRHGRGVDPGARAPFGINCAAQQYCVALLKARVLKPASSSRYDRKLRADFGALGTLANHGWIASGAEDKFKRIDENRLACAGFARQASQSFFCLNVERRDDDEVF